MITTVTGKNQVTIPAQLARQLDIQPGTQLDWSIDQEGVLRVQVLPQRGVLACRAQAWGGSGCVMTMILLPI